MANENTYVRKKIAALQQQLDEQHKAYTRLESELYQQNQEVERLKKENAGYMKNKRETEKKMREEVIYCSRYIIRAWRVAYALKIMFSALIRQQHSRETDYFGRNAKRTGKNAKQSSKNK